MEPCTIRRPMHQLYRVLAALFLPLAACLSAGAFVTESIGPLPETPAFRTWPGQSWWPRGIGVLAVHPARVYSRQSEAAEWIYLDARLGAVSELLALFSKAALRVHEVEFKHGPAETRTLDGKVVHYTVMLEVPDGPWKSLLNPDWEWREPRLTVYVDAGASLASLAIPKILSVRSALPEFSDIAKATPARTRFEGKAPEEEKAEATRGASGKRPWVLLHNPKAGAWVCIGLVRDDGTFNVWLSEEESDLLDRGEFQLMMSRTMAPETDKEVLPLTLERPDGQP